MPVTIIAEAGVNHNGNFRTAIQLCNEAKEVGADIIKFQTYVPEKSIRKGKDYPALSKLALGLGEFYELSRHCEKIGIEFCSTPDDLDSLKYLVGICRVKRLKMGSGSLTYLPLIEEAHDSGLPVLVSTGMATMDEIHRVVNIWRRSRPFNTLTLLHCVSLYPCPDELANLKVIDSLRQVWGYPVGYSDHTLGKTAICAAVTLGATVVEKHFTLDRNYPGPDHKMSMCPYEFRDLVKEVRKLESMLGDGRKDISDQEKAMIPRVRKDAEGFQPGL